jgi:hypothetical protein
MFILIGLLAGLVIISAHYVVNLKDSNSLPISKDILLGVSTALILIAYLTYYYISIRPHLMDILKREKTVRTDTLLDKFDKTKYGYHMRPAADFKDQLVLVEYFLKFQDFELQVEKNDYENFLIGDLVKISITRYTKQIIQMEKV